MEEEGGADSGWVEKFIGEDTLGTAVAATNPGEEIIIQIYSVETQGSKGNKGNELRLYF